MSFIETSPIKNTTIMLIYAEQNEIKLNPPYQRMGDIWNTDKRQLLIDSILNDYDIPKIYFHIYDRELKKSTNITYSVIDGRQRLEAIWKFIEGKFNLSNDFEYQKDPSIKLAGLGYEDIAKQYPRIKIQFDSFVLPIVGISTDDEDLIEDMFSRLNEAAPLNAAEKRNAFGGAAVKAIREIAQHVFFTRKVKFSNKRYQYLEVAGRLLLTENNLNQNGKLVDTKKIYLDNFVKNNFTNSLALIDSQNKCIEILDALANLFSDDDELLRSQGNMVLYYLLFRKAIELSELDKIDRRKLLDFRDLLIANRIKAENDYSESSFDLLEYDRLTQQGTNDASNIRERFRTLAASIGLSGIDL